MNSLLSDILSFNTPLLFTQFYFWGFLAVVYTLFALLYDPQRLHLRNVYLMFVSWFFYYKTSGVFLLLLAGLTLTNWLIAERIDTLRYENKHSHMRIWLWISVLIDLAALFYYKYAYFGVDVVNSIFGTHYSIVDTIILPVGISFYTFQVISYTVDVYRGTIRPVENIWDFAFYVAFFPQLVAGPIVRASEFVPQLYKPFHLSRRWLGIAVFWILNGLVKKIVLSDYLAVNFIDRVFDNPLLFSGFENLFALFAYSMQVYADFSGYTDIAIGVAMLFGFYLPKNFDSPYKSRDPQEFWRRWHQSLSRWLKGYVYIPLGGNRTIAGRPVKKLWAGNFNSFLTMLIGGLWHGASWNFVIWGGLNGIGMIVAKIWKQMGWHVRMSGLTLCWLGVIIWHWLAQTPLSMLVLVWLTIVWTVDLVRYVMWLAGLTCKPLAVVWAVLQTFVFITFTRLFFRSSSNLDPATANEVAWETAKNMVAQIGGAWNNAIIMPFLWEYRIVVILFTLGMLIHWLPERFKRRYRLWFAHMPLWMMLLAVVLTVFIIYQFISADMQPFIYFQF